MNNKTTLSHSLRPFLNPVSRIGLGTVQFGLDYGISNPNGKPDETEVSEILELATSQGIKYLDTANAYGESEWRLGKYGVKNFKVVTKFMPENVSGTVETQLDNSLKLLKTHNVYGYLSHRPAEILQHPVLWQKLIALRDENKIQKIGFSLDQPSDLTQLIEKNFIPDIVQVPYNYFDRRFESLFTELKNLNIEIHTRSAFLQGLFFLKDFPTRFQDVSNVIKELQRSVADLPSGLLQFVLNNKNVDVVVIGVQTVEQLQQIITGLTQDVILPELNQSISEDILMPSLWEIT